MGEHLGKFRARVLNNIDPLLEGRIQVDVPEISGPLPSSWAKPCVPLAGLQTGFFAMPPINSGVWVEFEQGELDRPIWVGCFWGHAGEVPAIASTIIPGTSGIAMQTTLQNGLVINDLPGPTGGIMLKSATGATIIVNDTGIYIQNGKGASIVMTGPTVTVNNGALVVT